MQGWWSSHFLNVEHLLWLFFHLLITNTWENHRYSMLKTMVFPGGRTSGQMLYCAVMCLQITFIDLSGLLLVTLELWNPEESGRKDENLCFLQLQQNWILAELAADGILHYPKGWQGWSGRFAAISIWYFHSKPACITPHSLSCSPRTSLLSH